MWARLYLLVLTLLFCRGVRCQFSGPEMSSLMDMKLNFDAINKWAIYNGVSTATVTSLEFSMTIACQHDTFPTDMSLLVLNTTSNLVLQEVPGGRATSTWSFASILRPVFSSRKPQERLSITDTVGELNSQYAFVVRVSTLDVGRCSPISSSRLQLSYKKIVANKNRRTLCESEFELATLETLGELTVAEQAMAEDQCWIGAAVSSSGVACWRSGDCTLFSESLVGKDSRCLSLVCQRNSFSVDRSEQMILEKTRDGRIQWRSLSSTRKLDCSLCQAIVSTVIECDVSATWTNVPPAIVVPNTSAISLIPAEIWPVTSSNLSLKFSFPKQFYFNFGMAVVTARDDSSVIVAATPLAGTEGIFHNIEALVKKSIRANEKLFVQHFFESFHVLLYLRSNNNDLAREKNVLLSKQVVCVRFLFGWGTKEFVARPVTKASPFNLSTVQQYNFTNCPDKCKTDTTEPFPIKQARAMDPLESKQWLNCIKTTSFPPLTAVCQSSGSELALLASENELNAALGAIARLHNSERVEKYWLDSYTEADGNHMFCRSIDATCYPGAAHFIGMVNSKNYRCDSSFCSLPQKLKVDPVDLPVAVVLNFAKGEMELASTSASATEVQLPSEKETNCFKGDLRFNGVLCSKRNFDLRSFSARVIFNFSHSLSVTMSVSKERTASVNLGSSTTSVTAKTHSLPLSPSNDVSRSKTAHPSFSPTTLITRSTTKELSKHKTRSRSVSVTLFSVATDSVDRSISLSLKKTSTFTQTLNTTLTVELQATTTTTITIPPSISPTMTAKCTGTDQARLLQGMTNPKLFLRQISEEDIRSKSGWIYAAFNVTGFVRFEANRSSVRCNAALKLPSGEVMSEADGFSTVTNSHCELTQTTVIQSRQTVLHVSFYAGRSYDITGEETILLDVPERWFSENNCLPPGKEKNILFGKIVTRGALKLEEKVLKQTQQVVTTSVTASAMAGSAGSAVDAQAISVFGMMSCSRSSVKEMLMDYRSLAPLYFGWELVGVIVSNSALVAIVTVLSYTVAIVVKAFHINQANTMTDAFGIVRFPSVVIAVLFLVYQGTIFASFSIITSVDATTLEKWVGFGGCVLAVGVPLMLFRITSRNVNARYCTYSYHLQRPAQWVPLFFLPKGRWEPRDMRRRFGTLMSSYCQPEKVWVLIPILSPTIIGIGAAFKPSTLDGCEAQYSSLGVFLALLACFLWYAAPFRTRVGSVLSVASIFTLSLLSFSAAINVKHPQSLKWLAPSAIYAQLLITFLRMSMSFVYFVWEAHSFEKMPRMMRFEWVASGKFRRVAQSHSGLLDISMLSGIDETLDPTGDTIEWQKAARRREAERGGDFEADEEDLEIVDEELDDFLLGSNKIMTKKAPKKNELAGWDETSGVSAEAWLEQERKSKAIIEELIADTKANKKNEAKISEQKEQDANQARTFARGALGTILGVSLSSQSRRSAIDNNNSIVAGPIHFGSSDAKAISANVLEQLKKKLKAMKLKMEETEGSEFPLKYDFCAVATATLGRRPSDEEMRDLLGEK